MHNVLKMFFCLLIITPTWAQQARISKQVFKITNKNPVMLTIKAKNISLLQALNKIAGLTNKKIYIDKKYFKAVKSKQISIYLKKHSLNQILEVITGAKGLGYSLSQNTITIKKPESKHFRHFLARYPKSPKIPRAYFSLGTFWLFKGKQNLALNQYRNLYRLFPKNRLIPHTLIFSAKILIKQRKYESARNVLSLFFNRYSKHDLAIKAFFLLGKCHFLEKDWVSALKVYKYLLNLRKKRDENLIFLNMGKVYFARKQYEMAANFFLKIFNVPEVAKKMRAQAMYLYIKCLYQTKKYSQVKTYAVLFYNNFSKLFASKQVKVIHAKVHLKDQEYLQVYYLLKPLLYQNSLTAHQAQMLAIKALEKMGLWQQIIEILYQKRNLQKALQYKLANAYQELGQWKKAKKQLEQIGSDNGLGYLAILKCSFDSGDYRACISDFTKYHKQMPPKVLDQAFALIGHSFQRLGFLNKAQMAFNGKWEENNG